MADSEIIVASPDIHSGEVSAEWAISKEQWNNLVEQTPRGDLIQSPPFSVGYRNQTYHFHLETSPNGSMHSADGMCSFYLRLQKLPRRTGDCEIHFKMTLKETSTEFEYDASFKQILSYGALDFCSLEEISSISDETLTFAVDVRIVRAKEFRELTARGLRFLARNDLRSEEVLLIHNDLWDENLWPTIYPNFLTSLGMTPGNAIKFVDRAQGLRDPQSYLPALEEKKDDGLTLWVPLFIREEVRLIKKQLDEIEAPLRKKVVQEMMELDLESPLFGQFLEKKEDGTLKNLLIQLGHIFSAEEERCNNDRKFMRGLIYFARYSADTAESRDVSQTYGLTQQRLMRKNQENWEQNLDRIDDFANEVEERFKYQSLRQPMTYDILEMYLPAIITQNRLRVLLNELADGLPDGRLYVSGFKSLYRIWEKSAFKRFGRWDPNIWDISRGLISYDTLDEIVNALEGLRLKEEIEIINVYNRFSKEKKDDWQDLMIHVRFVDQPMSVRFISEIQFSLQYMTVVRRQIGGHDTYAAFRSAVEVLKFVDPDGSLEYRASY